MPIESPTETVIQEELRGDRCEAKCPFCDEGYCGKDPTHMDEHFCRLCGRSFEKM